MKKDRIEFLLLLQVIFSLLLIILGVAILLTGNAGLLPVAGFLLGLTFIVICLQQFKRSGHTLAFYFYLGISIFSFFVAVQKLLL
ncbi:hypothetical protein [Lysinibacillus sp. 54212]|uniref:hypothetical protein n=1 Tax=Lysinibacillus sp. 54212 TaxID=3119829 RepID=UPI002FC9A543